MAYPNYYYPANYQPMQMAQNYQQPTNNNSNGGILWVQGEAGAKAYPVGAGNSVQLMDTEDSVFYIKTVDQSGMPQPLRIFDYTERTAQNATAAVLTDNKGNITREEFESLKERVRAISERIEKAGEGVG